MKTAAHGDSLGFRMAVTPVTAGLHNEVMQREPVPPAQERLPAVAGVGMTRLPSATACPTWNAIGGAIGGGSSAGCDWRADGYRPPTEAEWNTPAAAGTATRYAFGDDPERLGNYAWFADNASGQVQAVGQKWPNRWTVRHAR